MHLPFLVAETSDTHIGPNILGTVLQSYVQSVARFGLDKWLPYDADKEEIYLGDSEVYSKAKSMLSQIQSTLHSSADDESQGAI